MNRIDVLALAFVAALVALLVLPMQRRFYDECRAFGHTTGYCLFFRR